MKITHILTGKNDNYAGFFDDRLILTMKYNFHLYKRHGIEAEFILVEWASDEENTLLSEKLAEVFDDVDFKGYVVRQKTHDHIVDFRRWMVFLEFFAKNVGIRRAKHDYVLCSNADIFLTDDLLIKLKEDRDANTIYRAERHDIDLSNVKKLNQESFINAIVKKHQFPSYDKMFVDGSGDFTLAHKDVWNKVGGYDENQRFVKIHKDSRFLFSASKINVQFKNIGVIYHIDHGTSVPMTGLGSSYRLANGPYMWKYMDNLPYKNLNSWGLFSDNVEEKEIKPNISEILIKDYSQLVYPDDISYYIKHPVNDEKYPSLVAKSS
jgi:hypothetical protein